MKVQIQKLLKYYAEELFTMRSGITLGLSLSSWRKPYQDYLYRNLCIFTCISRLCKFSQDLHTNKGPISCYECLILYIWKLFFYVTSSIPYKNSYCYKINTLSLNSKCSIWFVGLASTNNFFCTLEINNTLCIPNIQYAIYLDVKDKSEKWEAVQLKNQHLTSKFTCMWISQ